MAGGAFRRQLDDRDRRRRGGRGIVAVPLPLRFFGAHAHYILFRAVKKVERNLRSHA